MALLIIMFVYSHSILRFNNRRAKANASDKKEKTAAELKSMRGKALDLVKKAKQARDDDE